MSHLLSFTLLEYSLSHRINSSHDTSSQPRKITPHPAGTPLQEGDIFYMKENSFMIYCFSSIITFLTPPLCVNLKFYKFLVSN